MCEDKGEASDHGIPAFLGQIGDALGRNVNFAAAAARESGFAAFISLVDIIAADAGKARTVVRFALSHPSIGS